MNVVLLVFLALSLLIKQQALLVVIGLVGTLFVGFDVIRAIKKRKITVDLLAAVALVASIIAREWFSVVFINLMITSARIFGNYTENVAGLAIRSLLKLRPNKVKIKVGEQIKEIPLMQVKIGDIVIVGSGDRLAVDGVVIEGSASIDQSSLTGESAPVSKTKGDKVLSSTLNVSGSLVVKAEKIGADTTFEKIIKLVEGAQGNKVKIQTMGERFATGYVLVSLVGSIALYLITRNLSLVLSVLLVVCADDIAVAIPMAFWASIAHAAKRGIIIKGGEFLEAVVRLKTLIVDKTGTLTRGKIKITGVIAFDDSTADGILKLVAEAESISEHPIAKAIVDYANTKDVKFEIPSRFKEYPGRGVIVYRNKERIIAGNLTFIRSEKVKIGDKNMDEAKSFLQSGVNLVFVARKEKLLGLITFEDELRPKVRETMAEIRSLGVENVFMLTGDNEFVARKVAREADIRDYKANLMPKDKLDFVRSHLDSKYKLAMVGDGVNDAASLAQADIGIAMGAIGSDAAVEAADVALMNDDFRKVKEFISIGHYTVGVARQNFVIWGIVNVLGLILVFSGHIGPSGAAAFNFITDFFPLVNSLRLLLQSRHA